MIETIHLVVHLLGAVEHIDHNAERSAQVLGGLRFPCAGGTSWGSTHGEVQRLGQCDVASMLEWTNRNRNPLRGISNTFSKQKRNSDIHDTDSQGGTDPCFTQGTDMIDSNL